MSYWLTLIWQCKSLFEKNALIVYLIYRNLRLEKLVILSMGDGWVLAMTCVTS